MPRTTNFDYIASFYDSLCKLVFGQTLRKAQIDLLPFIPANANILILGGGTGWIIDEIAKLHSSGLSITYVDSSSEMIRLSKKRNLAGNFFEFIQEPIETAILPKKIYNIIVTPFFFDAFSKSTCQAIFQKLESYFQKDGLWLYTDFHLTDKSKYWQKSMIKLMYTFFRITCKISANELPSINECFLSYKLVLSKSYYKDFIISKVFQK